MEITMEGLLKNNSGEMNTIVETFLIEETVGLIYDNEQLEKWNKHIEELGLKGQTQIVKTDKSPTPFMHLKSNLVNVLGTLCPRKVDVKEYSITPIPVEILDLIALSVNEKYFDKIQIWYDDKTPDPACIGLRFRTDEDRRKNYTWSMEHYLIGKWADVKQSFEELTNRAYKRWIQEKTVEYQTQIKYYQRKVEDIELEAKTTFGSSVHAPDLDLPF